MISLKQVSNKAREYSRKIFSKFYPEYLSPENFKLRSKNDFQTGYEQALKDLGLLTQEYYTSDIEDKNI